jgi:hypothetical protein
LAVGLDPRVWGAEDEIRVATDQYLRVANEVLPLLSVTGNAAIEPARMLAAYWDIPEFAHWLRRHLVSSE